MLKSLIQNLIQRSDLRSFFYIGEAVLVGLFLVIIWFLRPKDPESSFRVREADQRKKKNQSVSGKSFESRDDLAHARMDRKEPLRLEGIRLEARPHEILGVSPDSSLEEVQKAYRDMMKRYHPDRIGRPGSREWNDAQKIAEAINHAKEEMMKRLKKN